MASEDELTILCPKLQHKGLKNCFQISQTWAQISS